MLEATFVIALFLFYIGLWKLKQIRQRSQTGIDPQVMNRSTSNMQQYMSAFSNALSAYATVVILIHSTGFQWGSLFSRFETLSATWIDLLGFGVGLLGLSLCLYAQLKMGASWRVGIDEKIETQLVMDGFYGYIRNPTYLGLFILNLGIWLIWPTWTVFLLNILFVVFLEVQVRCEEDYLTATHGEQYLPYKACTKRYLPFVY